MIYFNCSKFSSLFSSKYMINNSRKLSSNQIYDLIIVGGGIVGTATARLLSIKHPQFSYALVEKESNLGKHQTSHNSGVIHAGIYYSPGSLKSRLCTRGSKLLYQYLDQKNINYKKCGKLIVAVKNDEIKRLDQLFDRGIQNKVKNLELIDQNSIKKIEPKCKGLKAIWSPETGIVNFGQVNSSFAFDFEQNGGQIFFNFKVDQFQIKGNKDERWIELNDNQSNRKLRARFVVTAAGLFSDRLAQMTGNNSVPKIVPFRGEYLIIKKAKVNQIMVNIYPVPDPRLPFLGIHITPRIDGSILIGPNAILAFKREGYHYLDIDLKDVFEMLSFKGLRRLMLKYFKLGFQDIYYSLNLSAMIRNIQNYVPELSIQNVEKGPNGVRAQALDKEGNLIEDFIFDLGLNDFANHVLHVRNTPSPAATSSLAIAEAIVEKVESHFFLFKKSDSNKNHLGHFIQ